MVPSPSSPWGTSSCRTGDQYVACAQRRNVVCNSGPVHFHEYPLCSQPSSKPSQYHGRLTSRRDIHAQTPPQQCPHFRRIIRLLYTIHERLQPLQILQRQPPLACPSTVYTPSLPTSSPWPSYSTLARRSCRSSRSRIPRHIIRIVPHSRRVLPTQHTPFPPQPICSRASGTSTSR